MALASSGGAVGGENQGVLPTQRGFIPTGVSRYLDPKLPASRMVLPILDYQVCFVCLDTPMVNHPRIHLETFRITGIRDV